MLHLLKIEYAKVKNYRTFWVILLIYAALVPLGFLGLCQFISNLVLIGSGPKMVDYAGFPDVWRYLTWTAAWWNIMLGILVVILTCNEISYRTQRQNIIDGLSRKDIILSKFYLLVALALAVTLYTALIGFIFGVGFSGFQSIGPGMENLGVYFVQTLGYFSFAYFFAMLIRKPALAIILYFVVFVLNLFWGAIVGDIVVQFIPTYLISGLVPFPFFEGFIEMAQKRNPEFVEPWILDRTVQLVLALVYIAVFMAIGYLTVKRRDL